MRDLFIVLMFLSFCGCTNKKEVYSYHSNGNVFEHFSRNESGHIEGGFIAYHENGVISEKKQFINGNLFGEYRSYYDNGQVELIAQMKHDSVYGEAFFYNRSGELTKISTYTDNTLELRKLLYTNGTINWTCNIILDTELSHAAYL